MARTQTRNESTPSRGMDGRKTVWARNIDVLERIHEPTMDLVVWERQLPNDLRKWLTSLDAGQLPCGRVLVRRPGIREALGAVLKASNTPDGATADALLHDIVDLAERFADIADCDEVDIRLDVVRDDSCWKFHRDRVALRLVTTYLGPGSQYVAEEYAEEAASQQKDYSGPIENIPEQAVALFKGALDAFGTGVMHRSPPIAGSGETRLLLCLNPPFNV